METNEYLEKALIQVAESQVKQFMESLENLKEGDLKSLEEQVLSTINAIGCLIMETTLGAKTGEQTAANKREGRCGHPMRLVGVRGKRLQTLRGSVTLWRAYYHCAGIQAGEEDFPSKHHHAAHGEAPADEVWGVQQHRCSVGVQQAISRLCASMTLEEAAESLSHLFPVQMSARQALNLIQPVGEAIKKQAEEQQQERFKQAGQVHRKPESSSKREQAPVSRLYVEMDGVMARLRRGGVAMEEKECKRPGDVYREVKVGAVFAAEPGRRRSELVPGVFVDAVGPKVYVARRGSVGDFAPFLYALAEQHGLTQAQELVVLGDGSPWIWNLVTEHFPTAVQIVDLWHARQHVWQVANTVFGATTAKGATWAEHNAGCWKKATLRPSPKPLSSYHPFLPLQPARTVSLIRLCAILLSMQLGCAIPLFGRKASTLEVALSKPLVKRW